MPHFYVPPENITGDKFRITGEDVHYLATVRRYGAGDKLKLFDGKGRTLIGIIDSVSKDEIRGTVLSRGGRDKSGVAIHLFQAVPKGARFDWLVEKAAELGVMKITPLITERSVVKEVSGQKLERWRRLSKAACQQSGRPEILAIERPAGFNEILNGRTDMDSAVNVIPWEAESAKTFKEAFNGRGNGLKINIFIGPEGGFSVKEIQSAQGAGLIPVTLGPRILRSETAGLISVILALNLTGDYDTK